MSAVTTRMEGGRKSTETREPLSQGMTGFFFVNGKSGTEHGRLQQQWRLIVCGERHIDSLCPVLDA